MANFQQILLKTSTVVQKVSISNVVAIGAGILEHIAFAQTDRQKDIHE